MCLSHSWFSGNFLNHSPFKPHSCFIVFTWFTKFFSFDGSMTCLLYGNWLLDVSIWTHYLSRRQSAGIYKFYTHNFVRCTSISLGYVHLSLSGTSSRWPDSGAWFLSPDPTCPFEKRRCTGHHRHWSTGTDPSVLLSWVLCILDQHLLLLLRKLPWPVPSIALYLGSFSVEGALVA